MGKIDLGDSARSVSNLPAVTPITFSLPSSAKTAIKKSIKAHDETMAKHDLAVLEYAGYGKDTIKTYKTSPDSYAQLVMGLAFYKMEGRVAPTYESAQTRKYRLGRTEVIRSTTNEALAWYKSMEDSSRSDSERLELFRKAAAKHIKLAGEAADGRGVDRHLFGSFPPLARHVDELQAPLTPCDFLFFIFCDRTQEATERGRRASCDLQGFDVRSIEQLGPFDVSALE